MLLQKCRRGQASRDAGMARDDSGELRRIPDRVEHAPQPYQFRSDV